MKRLATLALLCLCAAALCAAPAGAAEARPWWQLLAGSRPTDLQPVPEPAHEVQELKTSKVAGSFAAPVEVGGEVLACLGAGSFAALCGGETEFEAIETAAELQEALEEGLYGPGGVTVEGGPVGGAAFTVTTTSPGWVPPVEVKPLPFGEFTLGNVSWQAKDEGSGRLAITLTNLGDAPAEAAGSPLEITESLPTGVAAYGVQAVAGGQGRAGPVECSVKDTSHLSCAFEGELPPYEAIEAEVLVALTGAATGAPGEVSVSGAGADPVSAPQPIHLSGAETPFGFEYFSMRAEEEGGGEALAAGSHPFQVTNTVVARSGPQSGAGRRDARVAQPALPRNLRFTLPAGLVGNATAVPTCELATFLGHDLDEPLVNDCPAASAVGVSSATFIESTILGLARLAVPVFNLPPGQGEPARFGLMIAGAPIVIDTAVDPADSYRISAEVRNVSQVVQFLSATTTLWGAPGSPAHDSSRGWNCTYFGPSLPGTCEEEAPTERHETPFFRLPVSCASPLAYDAAIEPWNAAPGAVRDTASFAGGPLRACNQVPFDPEVSDSLTSRLASSPSGLDLRVDMPGAGLENPAEGAVSEAQFKRAEIAFPEGVTVNPSIAEGLATCSLAQAGFEKDEEGRFVPDAAQPSCPEASKIGSVQISTPLLEEQAGGAVYQATPYENATESLIGLYLVAKIPDRGILIKQPIEVRPDPRSGRLVSVADEVPQLPFSSFEFHFREGGRSPLITPPGCGTFTTTARFVPWSAADPYDPEPSEVVERTEATFTIDHGVGGGGCPTGPASFEPGFQAGSENNAAATYSPFLMRLTRSDGEQDITRFSSVLPPGVVGRIAGIPYCPESGIARAQSRTGPHGGAEERAEPSCPQASQIGTTLAAAGVGNQLTYVPGRLYLAGPYNGDPLSVVAITPALAGPFDAGTVVVREALTLDPLSAEVQADGSASDPIPHILKGIPLNVRELRVSVDRPEFTLNPTSCAEEQARATLWGGGTALDPVADHPVELTSRYQAAGCRALGFKPRLALKLKGGTRRGAHPALRAVLSPRKGDANFSRAVVTLPHSAFLEQAHIRTICTRVQFNAGPGNGARCPKGSVYGHAKAWSPLLSEPLKGPVFLRSSSHNLPDLVVALHGIVDIEISARIDSIHGGIRSTFAKIPDAPVSRFVLSMQGARKGLIVNSRNLCQKPAKNRSHANLKAQNGRRQNTRPLVRATRCAKAKRKHRHRHRRGRGH